MQHFKPAISNDASLSGNKFPIVASHGLAGSKSGGHRCLSPLMYKAKANSRFNGNYKSGPTFLFSVCGHPRIPHVSRNMDTSCRRKNNNGKRTRKRTRPIRFEHRNTIRNGIMFNFYPGLLHFIQIFTTLLASFSEAEHPSGACWLK